MPTLRCKLNYRFYELDGREQVAAMLRNGERRYLKWLGFMDVQEARRLHQEGQARPVKLEVFAYSMTDGFFGPWTELKAGQFIQGALVAGGVYAVTVAGVPRVI